MNSNCVPVYRDSIESEALMCKCIQSTLALIRAAVENPASDYGRIRMAQRPRRRAKRL